MKKWLLSFAWVLLGLLGVSAFVISTGDKNAKVSPSPSSYAPSGVSALADLLRMRGYQVVVDGRAKPKLNPGDVAISFELPKDPEVYRSRDDLDPDASQLQTTENSIQGQVKKGGLVFWLPIAKNFEESSQTATSPQPYTRIDGKTRSLSGNGFRRVSTSNSALALLSDRADTFISGERIGEGYEVDYSDAIGLTNRFLDKGNNAETFLELLKGYAPQAHRLVFTGATYGNVTEVGFLETLGPWAEGSWYQFLFLLAVVVFTWNQRFGLPIRLRKAQSGGRELVDALTDTMVRAKATGMGLESAYARADARVRRVIKLPRDASEGERDRTLPAEVLQRLSEVKAASTMDRVRPQDALTLVIKLENAVEEFEREHRGVLVTSRRRKKSA